MKDNVPALGVSGTTESTGNTKYVTLPNSSGKIYVRLGITVYKKL